MAAEKPRQDAFLVAIEAKISAWKAVADTYRAAVSLDGPLSEPGGIVTAVGTAVGGSHAQGSQVALPVGVFRDKSLREAIPIYLEAGRRKQTNKEIAEGLQAGGFPTMSENFEATVATALYRLKADGVILRFADGWDLASSYPESLRGRLDKERPAPRRLKAKVRRRPARETTKAEAPPASSVKKVLKIRRHSQAPAQEPIKVEVAS